MSKFFIILFILFLILSTAIVKNSTKRIDDEIFVLRESIRSLKKDFQNIKLEHDYLSSAEKLLEFQNLYFDSELIKKDIQEIKKINQIFDKIEINQFSFINE
jgi:cell division protein FtsL|tara:strand:+ start:72 stop:377 length:306 start_codon:yes stop_codon:yes gene_type:complete